MARDFVGGYGIGARLLYKRMRPNADPLGPEKSSVSSPDP